MLQPVARHRRHGAVAPLGALVGQDAEPLEGVARFGEPRRHDAADRDPILAALGDLGGGTNGLGAVGELAREVSGGAEPRVAGGEALGRAARQCRVQVDGAQQPVAAPVLGVRRDHGVGGDDRQAQPPRRREHRVALLPRLQLGVEIPWTAQPENALEEGGVAGEEDQAVAVGGEGRSERVGDDSVAPMHPRDRPAQRRPPPLVRRERDRLLFAVDQVRAEDRAHAGGLAGALEFYGAVDTVGVGAGERRQAPLGRGGREPLGARDADPEGEVGVKVEVGEQWRPTSVRGAGVLRYLFGKVLSRSAVVKAGGPDFGA